MKTNCETSNNSKSDAFHSDQEIANAMIRFAKVEPRNPVVETWKYGLNENYWTHGITISLGNGLNVSESQVKRRLRYIACRLKRQIWGHEDKNQRKIEFFVFKHQFFDQHKKKDEKETGSRNWSVWKQKRFEQERYDELKWNKSKKVSRGEHFHALMAVKGNHGRSDQEIADAITEIENNRKREQWEKKAHVDFDWRKGNRFHGYIGREVKYDPDSYFIMRI
jgi:hypothetical protein